MTVSAYAHEKIIMLLVFVELPLLRKFDGLMLLSIQLLTICSIVLQDGGTDIRIPAHTSVTIYNLVSNTNTLTLLDSPPPSSPPPLQVVRTCLFWSLNF